MIEICVSTLVKLTVCFTVPRLLVWRRWRALWWHLCQLQEPVKARKQPCTSKSTLCSLQTNRGPQCNSVKWQCTYPSQKKKNRQTSKQHYIICLVCTDTFHFLLSTGTHACLFSCKYAKTLKIAASLMCMYGICIRYMLLSYLWIEPVVNQPDYTKQPELELWCLFYFEEQSPYWVDYQFKFCYFGLFKSMTNTVSQTIYIHPFGNIK